MKKTISVRNRKIPAVASLSLIFGTSAVAVLGAWTYTEYRNATIASASVAQGVMVSTDGTSWSTGFPSPGYGLNFSAPVDALYPSMASPVAKIKIQVARGASKDYKISLSNSGALAGVTYDAWIGNDWDCSTVVTSLASNVATGSPATNTFVLPKGATLSNAGNPSTVCIDLNVNSAAVPSATVQNIFTFSAIPVTSR